MPAIIEKEVTQPKVDVLNNGTELPQNSTLDDIFSKIESGKEEGKETKDILAEVAAERAETEKTEPVKEEVKEVKEEIKEEPTDLEKRLENKEEAKKDEEITRDNLLKDTEHKEVKEDKQEVKEDKKLEDAIPEEELQPLPHDKPRTVKRIQTLLARIEEVRAQETNTKKEVAAKDAELKKLQEDLKAVKTVDPKTDEAVRSQLDELQKFRRIYELEKDPEVKTKFDSRITTAEDSIVSTLKANNAGEALLSLIKEEGGWNKFAGSSRQVSLNDGSKVTAAQLADQIVNALPLASRKAIDASMVEQINTARDKDRYLSEQKETAVKYFRDREEQQVAQTKAQQEHVKKIEQDVLKWYNEKEEKTEWLKPKPIPETATPEQKAEIEDENKFRGQAKALLKKSLTTKSMEDALQITFDSVQMYQERREKAALMKEVARWKGEAESKQKEIDKIRSASRSTPRSGQLAPKADNQLPEKKEYKTLEDTLAALASGELSRSQILTNGPESE